MIAGRSVILPSRYFCPVGVKSINFSGDVPNQTRVSVSPPYPVMSIPSESYQALGDAIDRLAAESILAQAGRDEGLVPAYSLLGDLRDLCSTNAELLQPIAAVHRLCERHLDSALPFDEPLLAELRKLVNWLPGAVAKAKEGELVTAPAATVVAAPPPARPAAEESIVATVEVMLSLNLEENRELLGEFFSEAVDHLAQIESVLLALEQNPDDPNSLNAIFRSFHTIKGNAGFLGLKPMQTLAHEVESLLDLARNHKLRLNSIIVTEILRSRDALLTLNQQVGRALENGQLPDQVVPVGHLIAAVKRLAAGEDAAEAPAPETVAAAPVPRAIPVAPPAPLVAAVVTAVESPGAAPAVPAPVEAAPAAVPGKVAGGDSAAGTPAAKAAGGATVRVNTEKLDTLMNVVGELVIVQSQLQETARATDPTTATPLQRNIAQLSRLTKELQGTAMSLRMIPIKATFQKMERVVRDLARDFGKKVSFVTSGDETELDRTVVEEIGDPLVHMVRNAVDHGLETTAARVAAGKSETGTLQLKAYHQGGNIVIELEDDGRGMDPDRIYKKAVEKGLIAAGAALSRDEILALILAPGFSTAEKVTSVSGRGVGMDVVKRNIEKLRGKIEISSELGRGSIFRLKLPLTMAIVDGLVVRVGADRFILPTMSVQMALRPQKENLSMVQGQGEVLDLRGRLLPVHRLNRCFKIPADATNPWDGIIVIVEHAGKAYALLVDEMVSKQEVVIKNLGALMHGLPGVAGGAILGDGSIALIIDPGSLLKAA